VHDLSVARCVCVQTRKNTTNRSKFCDGIVEADSFVLGFIRTGHMEIQSDEIIFFCSRTKFDRIQMNNRRPAGGTITLIGRLDES